MNAERLVSERTGFATSRKAADTLEPTRPPVKFSHRLTLALVPLAVWLVKAIALTMRVRLVDPNRLAPQARGVPSIYAFWHRHQLLAMSFFRNFGIRVLVSRSRDGDYIAAALERFGFGTVRSSSSSGKVTALRGLARELKGGRHAAITPDGPRGPAGLAQPGALFLSHMTQAPVVPFGCAVDRAWHLRSWDRFEIPKPFSRAVIVYGHAVTLPERLDEPGLALALRDLNDTLARLEAQAQAQLNSGGRS